jgi:hypothetical protein
MTANGRIRSPGDGGIIAAAVWNMGRGEDERIMASPHNTTSSIDVPSISRRLHLDRVGCRCQMFVRESTSRQSVSRPHSLWWMMVCGDQCCVSSSVKDRTGTTYHFFYQLNSPLRLFFLSTFL